jgi:hypothetical protein
VLQAARSCNTDKHNKHNSCLLHLVVVTTASLNFWVLVHQVDQQLFLSDVLGACRQQEAAQEQGWASRQCKADVIIDYIESGSTW